MRYLIEDKPIHIRNFDLHIHSTFSDGKMTPEEIIQVAYKRDVDVIALADHDTVGGIERAINAGHQRGIQVIPGIEMGVSYKNLEFHLLGYYFDYKSKAIQQYEEMMRHSRVERAKKIISELDNLGFHITYDLVEEKAGGSPIGRPHIAQVLVEKGYVLSAQDAFQHYLGEDKKANVLKEGVDIEQAFDLIKKSGGITVLAHPKTIPYFDELFPVLLDAGLDGIETFHPQHHPSDLKRLEELADANDLLKTGGSDCHGASYETSMIGVLDIPIDYFYQLQEKMEPLAKVYV